ncbi:DUF6221 family protein [Nonomuraea sp. NPDC049655]|uniref:DUF6221 family protein n=1 Tax=Nonomuraea sp. NPDC049655 TaxID=3364355 RepID=UPI0037964BE5
MSADLLSWLRSVIEGDKAVAEALPHGPWRVEMSERRYPQQISNAQAILIAETTTGPEHEPVIANYIALHDPRDTIARCDAELAILDQVLPEVRRVAIRLAEEFGGMWPDDMLTSSETLLLTTLASGYRHREGFNPAWLES